MQCAVISQVVCLSGCSYACQSSLPNSLMQSLVHAGGGNAIIRCEISLDDGKTWRVANLRRFFEPNDYGEFVKSV